MAYYALLSLFPLLLLLVVAASSVLRATDAQEQIVGLVTRVLPVSEAMVVENLRQVLRLRGSVSALAIVTLTWSASGFFNILIGQIDRAWPGARGHTFWEGRLLGAAMVAALAGITIVWVGLSSALRYLPVQFAPVRMLADQAPLVRALLAGVMPWLLPLGLFLVVYRGIPKVRVPWRSALGSAALATLAWRLATTGFIWYLRSGLPKYHLVYGSLSSVVILMFWLYLCNLIALYGAYLCAAVTQRTGDLSGVGAN